MADSGKQGAPTGAELVTLKLSEIVFDEGLYPRVNGHDAETVQVYARDIAQIEAANRFISVNGENVLIDGKHRFLAYRKLHDGSNDVLVKAFRYPIVSKLATFKLACSLQDMGRSLTNEDRIDGAKKLYSFGEASQEEIGASLGVSQATVSKWLSRTLKEEKERQKQKANAMWLACHTQEEIAEAVGVPQQTVADWIKDFTEICQKNNSVNWHGFDPPIYNIWKTQSKTRGPDHFGNSEIRWLENLLYLYTNPAGIVVDPFAGSGSAIDICIKRHRRYFVSDRKPIVEREHEIRAHDLVTQDGSIQLPSVPRWKDVELVFLDPPYWKQAEGQYSDDPTDLANMELDKFHKTLAGIISSFAKKIRNSDPRYIALLMQPTQWKAPGRQFVDHIAVLLGAVKLPLDMRYSVPYESQQCNAQMVEWAKESKRCLVLTRELIVWRVSV